MYKAAFSRDVVSGDRVAQRASFPSFCAQRVSVSHTASSARPTSAHLHLSFRSTCERLANSPWVCPSTRISFQRPLPIWHARCARKPNEFNTDAPALQGPRGPWTPPHSTARPCGAPFLPQACAARVTSTLGGPCGQCPVGAAMTRMRRCLLAATHRLAWSELLCSGSDGGRNLWLEQVGRLHLLARRWCRGLQCIALHEL